MGGSRIFVRLVLALACAAFVMTPFLAEAGGGYRHHYGYKSYGYKSHGYYGHKRYYGGYYGHGYHKRHHGHRGYRHRRHGHGGDHISTGEILGGLFLGGLVLYALTQSGSRDSGSRSYAKPRATYSDCRVTTGRSYVGNRVRLYEGTLCRVSGRAGWHLKPGSRRFVGYAD